MNQKTNSRRDNSAQLWVYQFVFGSRLSMSAVLLLLLSFIVQPFNQAYAQEQAVQSEETVVGIADEVRIQSPKAVEQSEAEVVESITDVVDLAVQTESSEAEIVTNASDDNLASSTVSTPADPQAAATTTTTSTSTLAATTTATTTTPTTTSTSTSTSTRATNTATTTPVVSSTNSSNDQPPASASTTTPIPQDGTATPDMTDNSPNDTAGTSDSDSTNQPDTNTNDEVVATSTTSAVEQVVELGSLVTNDNYYQFNRQSCVAIGDGTFHCSVNTGAEIDSGSVVYASVGENNSSEIFLRTKRGESIQITESIYDDTAPFYDPETLQIVWQRTIDGRQQIILYDIEDKKEMQLTFSRTNNMEPKVSSAGIVWQAWDGNDWEIMYFDGAYTEQITDNQSQDVTPVIEGEYILWTVLGGEEQEARVYSLADQEVLTISGHSGGAITNPRFILVYDTLFGNGDVVTQGFDPVTGLSAPIAAKPAPVPVEIPNPDPIGEIRALIQNKSSDEEDLADGKGKISTTDVNLKASTTPTDGSVLDLSNGTVTGLITTSTERDLELTEFDIIIMPLNPATSTDDDTSTQE